MGMYKVVDLFAGAGGLSLGFIQNGSFDIKVAFENNPNMQETYKKNHANVEVYGDVCNADYKEISERYGGIDVVIGGPPCQGFSNANRQKNTAISHNNMLVKQYIRAVVELKPKAFVMENVSMLKSDVHRFFLDKNDQKLLKKYSIPMTDTKLVLLDEAYVFPGVEKIVSDSELVDKYLWPEEDYYVLNVVYKSAKNSKKLSNTIKKYKKNISELVTKYSKKKSRIDKMNSAAVCALYDCVNKTISTNELKHEIEPVIMLQRMLNKLREIQDNHLIVEKYDTCNGIVAIIKSYSVFDYLKTILESSPNNYQLASGVLCAADYGAPQKRMRFVIIGIKNPKGKEVFLPSPIYSEVNYRTVKDAIYDLQSIKPVINVSDDTGIKLKHRENISELGRILRDSEVLYNHIITNTRPIALERFEHIKQGQNFHSLDDSLKKNTYTDVNRTQNTIYQRLDYKHPSGTVVNVRKSMWIHPTINRAISVREAARLQTFPDSFVFYGTKDKQYQQVGNAVPPIMAKAIADTLSKQL